MAIDILVSGRHPKLQARLQDSSLWVLAKKGVDLLVAQPTTPQVTLETAWKEFCTNLNGEIAMTMPDAYNQVRGLLAKIKRPYHSQSVQLVSGCEELATKFKEKAPKAVTAEMYSALKTALEETKKALDAAATVAYVPTQSFNFDSNPAKSSFTTAEKAVKGCFKAYQLPDQSFDVEMTNSRTSDTTRVNDLHVRFMADGESKISTIQADFLKTVTVVVKVKESQQRHTYNVESNSTLSLIMWKEASLEGDAKRKAFINKAYFQANNGSTLGLDVLVKSLPDGDTAGNKSVILVT
ncbi:hypothetical protein C8R45DRAFT_548244 [Mycena sanguinolenta]|nr:hypothetical protein C8R45DRAFT_548244 [Mycena sanguinolenta]